MLLVVQPRPAMTCFWQEPIRVIATVIFAVSLFRPAAGDSLYGTVRVLGTGEAVPGVRVSLRGRLETAVSDSVGRYAIHALPGRLELRFERLGFEPLAVVVMLSAGGAARVDVDLAPTPIILPPVTFVPWDSAAALPVEEVTEIGRVRLTQALASGNPLVGESEVFAAVAAAPFISGREELSPSLHVRGGAGDQNVILVDGIPWHGPRPLGGIAGLLPNGAVAAVDVHTAAPPPRYGDALSSVIVVQPRAAESLSAEGSLDPSTVEQTIGGPLPISGATLLVSGRLTYQSVFNRPDGAAESENGFSNVFGRLSLPVEGGRLDLYYLDARHHLSFPI